MYISCARIIVIFFNSRKGGWSGSSRSLLGPMVGTPRPQAGGPHTRNWVSYRSNEYVRAHPPTSSIPMLTVPKGGRSYRIQKVPSQWGAHNETP